jgi:penicillin-binding protein 2
MPSDMPENPFKIEKDFGVTGDLSGNYKNTWVEESFDIENGNSKLTISHTARYIGTSIEQTRIWQFLICVSLVLMVILGRVFYLQAIQGDYFRSLAEGNRIRLIPIPAERGIIYDRFNRPLLKNIPDFSLAVVPQDLPRSSVERDQIITKISEMSTIQKVDIEKQIKRYGPSSFQSFSIENNLDYDTALRLYVENSNLPGLEVQSGSKRGYFFKATTSSVPVVVPSLSHLIGYVGRLNDADVEANKDLDYLPTDLIGKTGLEKTYEQTLRGTYGRKKIEVNAIGKEQSVLAMEAPVPGKNLILSLDLDAQKKMEELVKQTAEVTGKRKIAAIALNPQNGEVLALVSWPSFDNNEFVNGIDQKKYDEYSNDIDNPLFNRAVGGQYPPGSTVKLVVADAALEEKIASKNTTVNSVGGITVGGSLFKDWKAGGHGITNVTKALAWSVNTYFYYVGGGFEKFTGLGIERLGKYFTAFGLGKKTNIDLTGESAGFIPSKDWKKKEKGESWFVGDTYNVSIGQGDLLVSPLQVAVWTSAVANGGSLITPHLGKKIIDPLTKKEAELSFSNEKIQGISSSNLQIVREGMRDCVTLGSCKLLGTLPFQAAGKTGTAQWSKTHPTHAWFTSFAPYQKPQIVVTVLVEDGGEGSTVAQPIAQKFLDWWGKKYLE